MGVFESLQLAAMLAVPLGGGAIGLLLYRIRSLQGAIDRHDERLDAHGERLAGVEATKGEIGKVTGDLDTVHRRVDDLVGEVSTVKGQLAEISNNTRLIHEHLLARP